MQYLQTPEEKAKEKHEILTMEWPLEPFMPMKRMNPNERFGLPQTGFIYRGNMDRVYLAMVMDVVELDQGVTEVSLPNGMSGIHLEPKITEIASVDTIEDRLKNVPVMQYRDFDDIIENGWIAD